MLDQRDFAKVEVLRKHLMITQNDMAQIFGVSRITYLSWIKGTPLRQKNLTNAKRIIRRLIGLVKDHDWPSLEVRKLEHQDRLQRLLAALEYGA
jgi:DNA-binding XRE family transcriptional regulator